MHHSSPYEPANMKVISEVGENPIMIISGAGCRKISTTRSYLKHTKSNNFH